MIENKVFTILGCTYLFKVNISEMTLLSVTDLRPYENGSLFICRTSADVGRLCAVVERHNTSIERHNTSIERHNTSSLYKEGCSTGTAWDKQNIRNTGKEEPCVCVYV